MEHISLETNYFGHGHGFQCVICKEKIEDGNTYFALLSSTDFFGAIFHPICLLKNLSIRSLIPGEAVMCSVCHEKIENVVIHYRWFNSHISCIFNLIFDTYIKGIEKWT